MCVCGVCWLKGQSRLYMFHLIHFLIANYNNYGTPHHTRADVKLTLDEAGSTGSLFLRLPLPDSTHMIVGVTYSETDNDLSRLGLDMCDVWRNTYGTVSALCNTSGSNRCG